MSSSRLPHSPTEDTPKRLKPSKGLQELRHELDKLDAHKQDDTQLDTILNKYKVIGVELEPWEHDDLGLSSKVAQEQFRAEIYAAFTTAQLQLVTDAYERGYSDGFTAPNRKLWEHKKQELEGKI